MSSDSDSSDDYGDEDGVDEWIDEEEIVLEVDDEAERRAAQKERVDSMPLETRRLYKMLKEDTVWFNTLDEEEKAELATLFKARSFAEDQALLQEGTLPDGFHIVTQGSVRVLKAGAGEPAEVGAGEYLGLMHLIADSQSSISVMANEGAESMFLGAGDFKKYRNRIQTSLNGTVTDILQKIDFAANLGPDQQNQLLKAVKPLHFNQGERVITQGEVGDRFYIILSGEAVVSRKDGDTDDAPEQMITHLHQGQWFGETALIYDDPRGASVSAATALECVFITKQDFAECKSAVLHAALEKVPLLQHIRPEERGALLQKLRPVTYEAGTDIMRQGETGDKFFVLTQGEVEVIDEGDGDQPPRVLTHLYEGAYFGEMALVGDGIRKATVRAVRASKMMALTKQDFDEMQESMEGFGQEIQQSMEVIEKNRSNRERLREVESMADQMNARRRDSFGANRKKSTKSMKLRSTTNSVIVTRKVVNQRGNKGQKKINSYNILSSLGTGSYGVVKLCQNQMDGQFYAMKILSVSRGSSKSKSSANALGLEKRGVDYDTIMREVELMKKLGSHPNIVSLHEVMDDPTADQLLLVLEYVSGGTLQDYDAGETDAAREIFHDMLKGVSFMHICNVIHRDLKPENFLVAADGVIKVADFGSALKVAQRNQVLSALEGIEGTPSFMPPELFTVDERPNTPRASSSARSISNSPVGGGTGGNGTGNNEDDELRYVGTLGDVWSLGATLFALVCGETPFQAKNEIELAQKVKHDELVFPPGCNLSPSVQNLLQKMLTKDPAKRITLPEVAAHDWSTDEGSFSVGVALAHDLADALGVKGEFEGGLGVFDELDNDEKAEGDPELQPLHIGDVGYDDAEDDDNFMLQRLAMLQVARPENENLGLGVRVGIDSQQGSRNSMEDRVVAFPRLADEVAAITAAAGDGEGSGAGAEGADGVGDVCYCAVYDGHSGTKCADVLKERLHIAIATQPSFAPSSGAAGPAAGSLDQDVEQAVISGCLAVDQEVLDSDRQEVAEREQARQQQMGGGLMRKGGKSLMKSSTEECSGACAAIAMLMRDGGGSGGGSDGSSSNGGAIRLLVAGVGDCRAVLCRRGTAIQLTKLHTASEKEERARIVAADGLVINNRLNGVLAVSRSFGDLAHKGDEQALIAVPQLHQEVVVDGFEFLILACDGVFDVLTNQEAVNFVRRRFVQHQNVQLAASELVQKALDVGSVDNCSAVVVALNQVAVQQARGAAKSNELRQASTLDSARRHSADSLAGASSGQVATLLQQLAAANEARAKAEARTKELERELELLRPGSSGSAIAVVKQEADGELAVELLREGVDYASIIQSLKARLIAGRGGGKQ